MTSATLPEAVAAQAGRPDAAVTFGTSARRRRMEYPELAAEIAAVAGGFARQGVHPGDRVMIRITSSREGVVALLGLLHLGAVPVSVKPRVPGAAAGQYFAQVAGQQQIKHAFQVAGQGLHELDFVLRPGAPLPPAGGDPDGVAFVQYTSGSTGMPRPIPLSHRALLGNVGAIGAYAGMAPGHTAMIALPFHHDMGLVGVLSTLVHGINVIIEEPGVFLRRPMAALRLVRASGTPRVYSAFPDFMLRYLASRLSEAAEQGPVEPDLLQNWNTVFCGAEPIRERSVDTFLAAAGRWGFPPSALLFSYGLAEASLIATAHRYVDSAASFRQDGAAATACLGEPIPGLELRVVDESGGPLPDGGVGTVQLRGPTLFEGYDGTTDHRTTWFDTGDLGALRSGRLYLSGRRGDRMSLNGVNVFATDIEEVATALGGIAECLALPYQESFAVLVVPERGRTVHAGEIAERITAEFGAAPQWVREVAHSAISRTASGKPARTHMTAELAKGLL